MVRYETFAVRLIRAQRLRNMTNRALAALVQMDEVSICRYRKGNRLPDWWALLEIARALNVSMDWLASRTDVVEVSQ